MDQNLAELLGSQKLWQRVPRILSPARIGRLFECPTLDDPFWRRDRAMLELLYATGCRASELSDLKLADVHLKDAYCICHGKGDKQRLVPIGRRARVAIESYLDRERGELAGQHDPEPQWLLLSRRGRLLRGRRWRRGVDGRGAVHADRRQLRRRRHLR